MDDKSGMKKKPSAVSARPAIRAVSGRGPAAPVSASPPTQVLAATPNLVDAPPKTESTQAPSGPNVKAYIERKLKSVYDDVLNQPIPDRFLELLNTLDKSADGDKPETEKK